MGIPTTENVIDSQSYILRDIADLYKDKVELVYPTNCVRRKFHDFARNAIVEDFLSSDCDVLWFLDSDITPSKYVLDLVCLHWDEWKIAGSTYPVFMTHGINDGPEVVMTVYNRNPENGNYTLGNSPKEGITEVDGLATGCLFIKKEVFSQLQKPYFEFKFNLESRDMSEGEDLGFIRKVNNLGIKFFTDFSLICKHQKSVDLLDVNNYAINYSNRSVLAYDASIQEQVKNAVQIAYRQGIEKGKSLVAAPKSTLWVPK